MGKATQTIRAKRPGGRRASCPTGRPSARPAGRSRSATLRHLDDYLLQLEGVGRRAPAGSVHWARDAAEANAIITRIAAGHGANEVVKIKSLTTDEIGLNEALAEVGHRGDRDRPGRADHPARRRAVVAHPRAGDPQEPRRDPRAVPQPARGHRGPDRRAAARWPPRPGRTCGRSSSSAPVAVSGANFGVAETGTICIVESEGNGRMCLTLPRVLISVMGIEKVVPTWQDFEVFLQLLPRSCTGRADEPVHLVLDRRRAGRRPAGVPPRPARQRPHQGPGRPRSAARRCNCIRCSRLPEHLPGLRADRRPRLQLGLSRPDRRDPDAAARRASRTPARCPTPRRSAAPATTSARSRSTSPRCWSTSAARSSATSRTRRPAWPDPEALAMKIAGRRLRQPVAVRADAEARPVRPAVLHARRRDRAACPASSAAGRRCATSTRSPAQTFREWWQRARVHEGSRDGDGIMSRRASPCSARSARPYATCPPAETPEDVPIDRVLPQDRPVAPRRAGRAVHRARRRVQGRRSARVAPADLPRAIAAACAARGVEAAGRPGRPARRLGARRASRCSASRA